MKLYILRHGEAGLSFGDDASRSLTARGQTETRAVVQARSAELAEVTTIIASPYLRARQTAAIAAELLNKPVVISERITPDHRIDDLAAAYTSALAADPVAIPLFVSHQPLVGAYIDWLAGLPQGRIFVGTSTLASLSTEVQAGGCGELHWLQHADSL